MRMSYRITRRLENGGMFSFLASCPQWKLKTRRIKLSDQFSFAPPALPLLPPLSYPLPCIDPYYFLPSTNPYASLISLNFSKAYDCLSHSSFINKLFVLNLPDSIHNWYVAFLMDRSHITRIGPRPRPWHLLRPCSIVHGSGVGPSSYDVVESDLHPKSPPQLTTQMHLPSCPRFLPFIYRVYPLNWRM